MLCCVVFICIAKYIRAWMHARSPTQLRQAASITDVMLYLYFHDTLCVSACIHARFPKQLKPAASIAYVILCCIHLHRNKYARAHACALPKTNKTVCFNNHVMLYSYFRSTICVSACTHARFPQQLKPAASIIYAMLYLYFTS